ncbi:hypothetical protein EHS25_007936 [Saitozyma podzolica]|uniref:Uncharacterized protein n=1 Tax=Saitozyma podzolica TaxID=1890683 RepID=A0A427YR35_9TREE|nr:hypothetical protein EHS25_007936 [Saitozyma podzolica]
MSSSNSTTCVYFDYTTNQNVTVPCNNLVGSPNLLSGQVEYSNYGYILNHGATYAFIAIYSLICVAHIFLGVFWKLWWTLPTLALGTLVEVIGWAGRVMSINTLYWEINYGGLWMYDFNAFVQQICCLVIAPTFYSAANYVLLGLLLDVTDPLYSSLDTRSIKVIFITSDVLCLLVQAGGGAWAGTSSGPNGGNSGAYMMSGGVILQLVVTIIFIGFFSEWLYRWRKDRPVQRQYKPFPGKKARAQAKASRAAMRQAEDHHHLAAVGSSSGMALDKDLPAIGRAPSYVPTSFSSQPAPESRIQLMAGMITFSTVLIVVRQVSVPSTSVCKPPSLTFNRSIYRSIELLRGWTGPVAVNEPLFLGMDATMMAILSLSYAIIHPGLLFGRRLF